MYFYLIFRCIDMYIYMYFYICLNIYFYMYFYICFYMYFWVRMHWGRKGSHKVFHCQAPGPGPVRPQGQANREGPQRDNRTNSFRFLVYFVISSCKNLLSKHACLRFVMCGLVYPDQMMKNSVVIILQNGGIWSRQREQNIPNSPNSTHMLMHVTEDTHERAPKVFTELPIDTNLPYPPLYCRKFSRQCLT